MGNSYSFQMQFFDEQNKPQLLKITLCHTLQLMVWQTVKDLNLFESVNVEFYIVCL